MQTVNLTTKDADINVVMGTYYAGSCVPSEEAYGSLKYLYSDLTDIRKYYIRLGFHLDEFERCEYYKQFGYLTLEAFCDKNLGLDKSAVSRCINVYREFNASNCITYKNGIKSQGAAIDLGKQWKDYSYTQLCEMLPLSEEQRRDIKPDMTVKEIREYKKSLKNTDTPVASTQPDFIPFDYDKYFNSVNPEFRSNLVKKCSAVEDGVIFDVFDKDGRFLGGNVYCELIYSGNRHYFFRLCQSFNDDGTVKN